ncbi:hypothetical protein TIFTF001_007212 [Ficus carica]|uniref:Uncharacterized protein n=1 Tax=Ficus carica TaxID=3494 RepID=A0AA87ZPX1_FICCA|nr:hypothetical protein TIFTF001_007212 [Ficus carica]
MAIVVEICEGLSLFVTTLWDLQEMRFAAIFDGVTTVAITVIFATVSCLLALRRP